MPEVCVASAPCPAVPLAPPAVHCFTAWVRGLKDGGGRLGLLYHSCLPIDVLIADNSLYVCSCVILQRRLVLLDCRRRRRSRLLAC